MRGAPTQVDLGMILVLVSYERNMIMTSVGNRPGMTYFSLAYGSERPPPSGKFWSIEYYQPYFDVDTKMVWTFLGCSILKRVQ